MSQTNGSGGDHHSEENENSNVVQIPSLKERDRLRRLAQKQERQAAATNNPAINLPPVTKILLAVFIGIHLLMILLPGEYRDWIITEFGFTPGRLTGAAPFSPLVIASIVTHLFIHGGWAHIIMNSVMLAAFGSGMERWMGARRMIVFFLACGLFGAAAHFAVSPLSTYPVIGASGGLSGFFAAALVMFSRSNPHPRARRQLMIAAGVFIAISLGFALLGGPGGASIAWAAHVGGFLGGFILLRIMKI
jgi:membrane associated rhomboid family serine protease